MKRLFAVTAMLLSTAFLTNLASAQKAAAPSPVVQALDQEMKRAFDLLKQKGDDTKVFNFNVGTQF